jgi:hypothetical protein
MKVKDRFYVGARDIGTKNSSEWAHSTSREAVIHAKQLLEEDPTRTEAIIVKIVGVVRRKPQFSVEEVS